MNQDATCQVVQPRGLLKRQIFLVLAHLGLVSVYSMRMDLSEASEPMQKHFGWSDDQQSYVLSSFFWGYALSQIPGSIMARWWGGKQVFGFGVLGTSVLTIVLPLCTEQLWLLCLIRAFMGLLEAVTYPAMTEMFTHWVPASERASSTAITNAGAYLGTAIAMPISGSLIGLGKDSLGVSNTWPYVFYAFGAMGCIWFIIWELCVARTPAEHSTITAEELAYLEATTRLGAEAAGENDTLERSAQVPWAAFFTHPVALTMYFNHFSLSYGDYTMMTYMPKFLDEQLGMDMQHAGYVALLPYLLLTFTAIGGGVVADRLRLRFRVRAVTTFFQLVGTACAGGLLFTLSFVTDNRSAAVATMTLAIGAGGLVCSSFNATFLDVSPHYAGQLYAISNTLGNTSGIVAPLVAGHILNNQASSTVRAIEDWRLVFCIVVGLYAAAGVLWVTFIQSKPVQSMN